MASEPVRVALVGAGRMGSIHLEALRASTEIELVGVVEPRNATRGKVAASGVPTFSSVDELLAEDPPPDGVLIAAPSTEHPSLVTRFAAARVPMLCEKPVGVQPDQAGAAVQSAQAAGVLLQVGYWRRFVPELRDLREKISNGGLGKISQLSCLQWDHQPPSEQFRSHSGGITVDMGVHEFDQTRWLLGQEFKWVVGTAAGPSREPRDGADPDCAVLLAGLSDGTAATISLGRHFPHEDSCWLEVWGSEGYARVPFMWDTAGEEVFRRSMQRQAEAFARALRGSACEGAQGEDAVAALTVAALAAESLTAGDQRVPGTS